MSVPDWARSIRFRLTVLYSSLIFAISVLLVAGLYFGLSQTLKGDDLAGSAAITRVVRSETGELVPVQTLVFSEIRDFEENVDQKTLSNLRFFSFAALGGLFLISVGTGWAVSGRVLRPVGQITGVARDIQASNLSRRIELDGPRDELKDLADTFDEMLGRINSAFSAQRRFIADASHELRNPLAIIRTNLDVALSDPDATAEELREHARVARGASDRMARLVDDLLALARLETPTFANESVDVAAVAAEAGNEYVALAAQKDVHLERALEADLRVHGDRDALKRAVANLLDNAVRHAPEGSTIELTARRTNGNVRVGVADLGPGLSDEDQKHVFERFWRADSSRSRQHGGTGLGLAIVKRIAESHGGDAEVVSELGNGARFEIVLPSAKSLGSHSTLSSVDETEKTAALGLSES